MNRRVGRPLSRHGWRVLTLGGIVIGVLLAGTYSLGQNQPALKPELSRVVSVVGDVRNGRMADGTIRKVFHEQNGNWSAVLLENQMLAALEDRLNEPNVRQLTVEATGVVHVYRGRNYLLLTAASVRL